MKNQNILKSCLKGRVRFTLGLFVAFMINGIGAFLLTEQSVFAYSTETRLSKLEEQLNSLKIAIGRDAKANSNFSVALGGNATVGDITAGADAEGGVALGYNTQTLGENGVSLGRDSMAVGEGAVAIGLGSIAGEDQTVSFGQNPTDLKNHEQLLKKYGVNTDASSYTRRLVNVSDGINPTDVATVRQLNEIKKFDIVSNGKQAKIVTGNDGKFYDVSNLEYKNGKYYEKEKIEGMAYNSDGLFYPMKEIGDKIYVNSENANGKKAGYYDKKYLKQDLRNGAYMVNDNSATPVEGKLIQEAKLENYTLKNGDNLKLKIRNYEVDGQPVMAMTNLGKGEISENSTDAINGSQIYTLQNNLQKTISGQKTVFTADNYAEDNSATKLETELGTPIQIVSGDFEGSKVTTNGSAQDNIGNYKKENIAVNVVDGKVQIGLDTKLTGMDEFRTAIAKYSPENTTDGYIQHEISSKGVISKWTGDAAGIGYPNAVSATLRAGSNPIHQGLVISGLKNGSPMGTATYNLGYMDITANKADGPGEDKVKMDPQGLHFQENNDSVNSTDVIALTKATEGKKSALTFKLDENSKGTGEVNGLANGEISADSTQAINGSQLKGFADKIGLVVDTDNTVKAPELKDIRNKKPTSIIDATNKLATEVNKGFNVAAVKGTQVTKNLGDTVTIKNGDLSETQFVGKNLSTEIKDGNFLIGMKDKPEFSGVIIKRDAAKPVNELGNDEVLTKAETSALAKSSIKVINGTNTTVSEGTEGEIKTYAVNISDEAIKNAVKGDLDSKADVTALNELKDQINTSKDTDDKRNEYLGGSDNLNNVAINDKVNAIRRGEAGSIVYTDRENARIKRAKDGKLYKENDINPETDLPLEDTDVKALETTSVIASVVNVDGSTTNKTILSNIADGVKDNDAVNVAQLNQVKENLNTATENLGNIDKKIDGVQTKVNDNSSKLDNLDKALNEAKGLLAGLGDRLEDDNDSRNLNNDNLNGDTINNKINAIRRGEAGSLVYTDGNGERVVKADNGNFYRLKDVDGATNNPLEDKVSNIVKSEDVVQTLVNTKGETTEPIKLKNVKAGNVGANSTDAVNGDQLYKYSKWKIQTEDNESTRGTVGYDPDSEGNEVLTLKTKNSIDQDETSKNLTISNIGNTVEFSLNKDIKVETVNANKIVINRNDEVTEDSDVLNKKETTELIKNTVKTDMDSKMNKDLSNIDNAGEQKIKDIAKTSITTDLENYAKKDASNIVKENWTKALGTGEITETSEELVTGKTVKAALDTKAEKSDLANLASKNLDNLSDKGREVINKQAKEALKSDFETANKNIKSNADAIDKNKESIKAVDKVSSENTKAIKQNTSDIKDNKTETAKNKAEIAKVKDKADKNEKNIDANKKAIANHEERITKNEKILKETYQAQAEVIANHAQAINENRNAIRSLNNRVDHLDDKLNKGMALMSAMTTVDFQDVNAGEMGIGAGIGSYGGSQGVAVGVAYSPSENFRINAKYSVSTSDIKTSAVGVGAVYKFKVR